jgi:AcrR family transcriptional regulator
MADAVKGAPQTRAYSSTIREEGALATRRAITAAAARRFVSEGYAATSLAAIARDAGCARPTVFAVFGSKLALMKQVLDEALAGDDEPVPVSERPWFQPVWAASTRDELCAAYADVCLRIARQAAPMFEVVRRAVDADPEARALWDSLLRNRRAGAQMVAERAVVLSGGRRGQRFTKAVDQVWLLNDPAHYASLVGACGWSEAAYREWLAREFASALSVLPD